MILICARCIENGEIDSPGDATYTVVNHDVDCHGEEIGNEFEYQCSYCGRNGRWCSACSVEEFCSDHMSLSPNHHPSETITSEFSNDLDWVSKTKKELGLDQPEKEKPLSENDDRAKEKEVVE